MAAHEQAPDPAPPAEVPYDQGYAATYSQRWWSAEEWEPDRRHFEQLLGTHLSPTTRWLDVGCGTGYFLSCFPDVPRAGVDLSDAMLEVARVANPDALELRQGDVRAPHEPWNDQWDVVSCTGEPWSYLPHDDDFRLWVRRMAEWTSPEGVCINQTPDIHELVRVPVDYWFSEEQPPAGHVSIQGVIWDMAETDVVHGRMIWPSIDLWARWYGEHFRHVAVVHPTPGDGVIFGRAIVASQKRASGDVEPATIVYEPPPTEDPEPLEDRSGAILEQVGSIRGDISSLHGALFPAGPDSPFVTIGATYTEVSALRGEVAALHQLVRSSADAPAPPPIVEPVSPPPPIAPSPSSLSLSSISTKRLGREVLRRLRPRRLLAALRRPRSG